MKVLLVVFLVAAVSQASNIDWDNLKDLEHNRILPSLRFGHGRVVGGEEAAPHQFPYQAGLILTMPDGQQSFCGGSLISPTAVLTVAHCVYGMTSIDVILGAHNIRDEEEAQVRLTSNNFIIHPKWSALFLDGDIAIVKLPEAVELNDNVNLINLPSNTDDEYTDDIATVSGWGIDSDSATANSPVLRYTSNPVISNRKCIFSFPLRRSHLCVSGNGGKSACFGDVGDPLTVNVSGTQVQIGLFSYGSVKGCEKGSPAVYTRVTSYLDWINQNA